MKALILVVMIGLSSVLGGCSNTTQVQKKESDLQLPTGTNVYRTDGHELVILDETMTAAGSYGKIVDPAALQRDLHGE